MSENTLRRICGALDKDGFICTLDNGHEGDHTAQGVSGHAIRCWPRDDAEPEETAVVE